ncbi:nucleotide exchange factor GrpE [Sphingobacteriaceae bacterium WQ 2009]|uniref:Protein GrpE n=1 Tax=Rhinopithecimicrobium faecis TaxID=2820698 RepID=A0A8T4HAA0_9SPHI|nr:nucleotide exchange factor GrpE [Sphingobacteriaceae bacterium WQ 2009]
MSDQEKINEEVQEPTLNDQNITEEATAEANSTEETSPEEEPLTPEQILTNELAEVKDKYIRLSAEFDNYRKRTSKERSELIQSAGKDVIKDLLSVIDDFDRALNAMETATEITPIREGIEIVNQKLRKTLEQKGLKEMEAQGLDFDADLQEAITAIPAPTPDLKNKVIDVIEKGYYLNDRVIRHAKVVIGK